MSHDFRLIDQVADQIWVCENKKVTGGGEHSRVQNQARETMGYSHI